MGPSCTERRVRRWWATGQSEREGPRRGPITLGLAAGSCVQFVDSTGEPDIEPFGLEVYDHRLMSAAIETEPDPV
jgi:hypothetical protein